MSVHPKDEIVPGKRVFLIMVALVATMFAVVACSEEVIPTQEPVEFHPTAAAEFDRPDSSGNSEPDTEAADTTGGDADAGKNAFVSCSSCHSTGDNTVVGPGLQGVYARAATRTSLDAEAYLEESMRDPGAFIVDSFPAVMPSFSYFSDEDVDNLIAYLKTLE